jgi:hypothetical protein
MKASRVLMFRCDGMSRVLGDWRLVIKAGSPAGVAEAESRSSRDELP